MSTREEPNNNSDTRQLGGKGVHLELLRVGGFKIPVTLHSSDPTYYEQLKEGVRYIVRSSAPTEDSESKTAAGLFRTIPNLSKEQVGAAVTEVTKDYGNGNAVIQPDLSSLMGFSGVAYSNLNGRLTISMGRGEAVHGIVEGTNAETEVSVSGSRYSMKGEPVDPTVLKAVVGSIIKAERYFGVPLDVEFTVLKGDSEPTFLQARPLPNAAQSALREHEARRVEELTTGIKSIGVQEIVLSVGNHREIIGDDNATRLSVSIFSSIFTGDGKSTLGAFQLGRNELGYDIGAELYPSTLMVGGKVYMNFASSALEFRPKGISLESLVRVVNDIYMPMVRETPGLLNYPELGLFVQFPQQAKKVGLDPEPYATLNDRIRGEIERIVMLSEPPRKKYAENYDKAEDLCKAIEAAVKDIREGSAREYVKAARYAFFSLEDLRTQLEDLRDKDGATFKKLANSFGMDGTDVMRLRDSIAYDQSIVSFEMPKHEDFRYQGSFELSLPRDFAQDRKAFKPGRAIEVESIAKTVDTVRRTLEYREKMKFYLFRDYDHLKQLCDGLDTLTERKGGVYSLDLSDLPLLYKSPRLADYKIDMNRAVTGKDLFPDPIFQNDLRNPLLTRVDTSKPRLIFGALPKIGLEVQLGIDAIPIRSVDQTVDIPEGSKVIFVQDNIKPGSHLFTLLSDFGIPVISMSTEQIRKIEQSNGAKLSIVVDGENVNIIHN